jgi:cytoskeletal protein RodZ
LASFDIGAKLRQERISQGLSTDVISRDTRIPERFLIAIEKENFSDLPGLIFARNFVKQYALALKLDPDPLLAELPKQDQSTVQLPDPPARRRSLTYHRDRTVRSVASSAAWIALAAGAMFAAYVHFNHTLATSAVGAPPPSETARQPQPPAGALSAPPAVTESSADAVSSDPTQPEPLATAAAVPSTDNSIGQPASSTAADGLPASLPVNVALAAGEEEAWIQVTADGKPAFTGTLHLNETKQISAIQQIRVLTGNAGALKIWLNGRELNPLGPLGQIRLVKLTAEGPQLLTRAPQPEPPDPL